MLTAGLDIAKDKIDIYLDGQYSQIANNEKCIKNQFEGVDRSCRIVLEATGKYHRLSHQVLDKMGFEVMVVNPYQSKHFAKAMNVICKTDKVDAKILADYAERMQFKATAKASEDQEKMQDLSRYLDDLKQSKHTFDMRLRESVGFISESLHCTINTLVAQISKTEAELKGLIVDDAEQSNRMELLMTIPGIGERTAISLLSYLRELGTANKRQIAALSGLAPMNNDSGTHQGKRRIRGGRRDVRRHLYMPILGAATQHNKRLNVIYTRLVEKGKPKKVALTACMRKLVVWANAILTTGQPWQENNAEIA